MIVKGVEGGRPDNYDSPCVPSKERTEDDIVRAQGLGKVSQSREANRPRPTIVRFKVWQDKMLVLANKSAREILRKNEIFVDYDLTKRQREKLNDPRTEGKHGFHRGDRLVTRKKVPSIRRSNGGDSSSCSRRNNLYYSRREDGSSGDSSDARVDNSQNNLQ